MTSSSVAYNIAQHLLRQCVTVLLCLALEQIEDGEPVVAILALAAIVEQLVDALLDKLLQSTA